ncbi:hypothetical protein ACU635_48080 [[Actinomadura] parvosata]|uniref:hypothetical protein n=1 Tax=[Actinomadura] parvosata TaxID=1955412 RepID=UPI00406CDDE8
MASAGAPEPLTGHAGERRRRRGLALRISTLLLGVLHLVLAAVLIALPGRTPAFDPLPTPDASAEPGAERRIAAITPHPASAPASVGASSVVRPTARTAAAPEAATSTAPTTPRPSSVPTRGSVPPSGGQEASKPVPAIAPSGGRTTRAGRPARTPSPAIAPAPEVVSPGRTREPPGRVRGSGPGRSR